ncbi:MAG TPA: gluconokinase [Devosia sp.]|nr:gluconokinase [Devosia sp.]
MGVSGSGKTTLGLALAERLAFRFYDADDFHPPANVAKMAAGLPLDDTDRQPWLDRLAHLLATAPPEQPIALACSALRRAYRDRLRAGCASLIFAHLGGSRVLIAQRLATRRDHYMPPSLLSSQFDALELPAPDEAVLLLDSAQAPEAMVDSVSTYLSARPPALSP